MIKDVEKIEGDQSLSAAGTVRGGAAIPSRRLRILQVASGLACLAGTEKHVLDVSAALRKRGHCVTVACRPDCELSERAVEFGLQTITLEMWRAYDMSQLPLFVRAVRNRYDVIHTHSVLDYVVPAVAGRIARVPAIVMTRHLPHPFASRVSAYACSVLLYDRLIAVSDYIRSVLIKSGAQPARVTTVRNGVDHKPPPADSRQQVRNELRIPKDAPLVAAAGRLSVQKGFDVLLRAIHHLQSFNLKPYCIIAGSGPMSEELRSLAVDLHIDASVRFLGFRNDVGRLFAAADVAAVPSIGPEAFGYVAVEALAAGAPIVASAIGALPEVFGNDGALLVRPGDETALASALASLLRDCRARNKMHTAALARAEAFTLDACASALEDVYDGLVRRPLQ